MPNINGTLDVVLGFITVVLVLSLIIQSLQNVIKRLLRMKSRQAEHSLRLLFDYVLTKEPTRYTEMKYASPIVGALAKLLGAGKDGKEDGVGGVLVEAVKREVRELGRTSYFGNALLDSVTKDDLDKILKNLDVDALSAEAKAAINGKVGEVEKWYDTVMPGLAERYERGMKWMAVLISAIVVILVNADAIRVYKFVASDPVVQQQLLEFGQKLIDDRKNPAATKPDTPPKPNASNSNTAVNSNIAANPDATANSNTAVSSNAPANANSNSRANTNRAENSNAVAKTDAEQEEANGKTDEELVKDDIKRAEALYAQYRKFGLRPFNWEGSFTDYRAGWHTILGWLAMTLLLSLGAPFWEDALESVFGLKNTLRSKAKTEEKKAQQP